jgi:hypothetical protein
METIATVWKARVDAEILSAERIEAALRYSIKALGCLPISMLTLWAQLTTELTDRIGLNTGPTT